MPIESHAGRDEAAYAARLATVLEQLRARRHELCTSLVDEYTAVMAEYRELPESVLIRDVTDAAVQNIEYLVDTFAGGFAVPDEDIQWIRRSAARRVHQHVSLPSLLRTYRLWGTRIWRTMAEFAGDDAIGKQLSIDAADAMMEYLDRVSNDLSRAYIHESTVASVDGQALRTDVLETVLTGDPVSERARRQAAVLGTSLRGRLMVVVVRVPDRDHPLAGVQAAVLAVRDQFVPLTRSFLTGPRDHEIVCICVLDYGEDGARIEAACHDLAAYEPAWTVGIGRIAEGVAGVRRSYTEAHEAAELGFSIRRPGRAIRFADVLLDQILRSTRHIDALLEETVRPLVDYDEHKNAELLATLRAYVNANFNLTRAAAELTVNPNTVVYRLRRIRTLTHRDPMAVDDLLLLALGVRLWDTAPPL
ncbi:PucR family transcriptional regulator [Streptomyces sp. NBC_01012]|uniref:PucR family transcriptional regulator n=1 Tax=Streptomyces sp. NBC_01012 TaxID=2903717 RepID=UPI00386E215E|nr:helix-turn-helix domain-containing protein [Streptomyces sp. NBC_01012]